MNSTSSRILILDGGMGTTLEALGHDVSGPMWGSELVAKDPSAISKVHSDFAQYADLIETATYQMTEEALIQLGHDQNRAHEIMHQSLEIAVNAARSKGEGVGVVLSIGPYGATLRPGQEYTGFYPPPYGPRAFSKVDNEQGRTCRNTNTFEEKSDKGEEEEKLAEKALEEFHFQRLKIFEKSRMWDQVTWIAFETIPLIREIRAIRRAMNRLDYSEGQNQEEAQGNNEKQTKQKWEKTNKKRFWITCAFPDGHHGQIKSISESAEIEYVSVDDVVQACIGKLESGARPDGIGVNCTNPSFLEGLVKEYTEAVVKLNEEKDVERGEVEGETKELWLVCYPDGGSVYDVLSRTWTDRAYDAGGWAKEVWRVAHTSEEESVENQVEGGDGVSHQGKRDVWCGLVVGGCCKTGVDEIRALKQLFHQTSGQ